MFHIVLNKQDSCKFIYYSTKSLWYPPPQLQALDGKVPMMSTGIVQYIYILLFKTRHYMVEIKLPGGPLGSNRNCRE